MIPIQVNEQLFAANQFFSGKPERLEEAKSSFQFDQRRVVLGQGSLDKLGEECQRLRAGRVLLRHIVNGAVGRPTILFPSPFPAPGA